MNPDRTDVYTRVTSAIIAELFRAIHGLEIV